MGFRKLNLLNVILIVALLAVPAWAASTVGDDPSLPLVSGIYDQYNTSDFGCDAKFAALSGVNGLANTASHAMPEAKSFETSTDQSLGQPFLLRPHCPHRGPPHNSLHQTETL